jgi:hypothetical protein
VPRHLREPFLPVSPPSPPDHLEGLFRRLVANIAALDPGALHRPVKVSEIHERLVPYRTHRAALGFDTNEDYEMTLLRLLAGERGFAEVFPEDAAGAFAREAESVNPDTALFRLFPDATVLLDPDRMSLAPGIVSATSRRAEPARDTEPDARPPAAVREEDAGAPGDEDAEAEAERESAREQLPFVLDDSEEARVTGQPRGITASAPCPYCGGGLPVGRTVLFCPHCGQNIGVVHCPTCGSELDVGWQFCITCGQKVQGLG